MMSFADQLRPVAPVEGTLIDYPPCPRGRYLYAFRKALDLTLDSAGRVLGFGGPTLARLESGALTFADRATWTRAELVMIDAAGPGWCGEASHHAVGRAARLVGPGGKADIVGASQRCVLAALLQIQTVKRGILYRLAASLAVEAGRVDDAVKLARAGLGGDVGPMPSWLEMGLQAVIAEASPAVAEAVS